MSTLQSERFVQNLLRLKEDRLLGVVDLLHERGSIDPRLYALSKSMGNRSGRVDSEQLVSEKTVASAFAKSQVRALVIKGVLLGWSIYPEPNQRLRTDMDILVAPYEIDQARKVLFELGYRPLYSVKGGTPMEEEAWRFRDHGFSHMVDLHWKLRGHPCLRDRLRFDEQWRESIPLPALADGVRGQSLVHAMLTASMHWFDSLYAERYPRVWLLDMDLIWRAMDDAQRQDLCQEANERGLSALVAENLREARDQFRTPIDSPLLESMIAAGSNRRPTRLIQLRNTRFQAHVYALRCEPGLSARFYRLRSILFPPAAYLNERFPEGSKLGLPGLHFKRLLERFRRSKI